MNEEANENQTRLAEDTRVPLSKYQADVQAANYTTAVERHVRGILQRGVAKHLSDVKAHRGNPASRDKALAKVLVEAQLILQRVYNPHPTSSTKIGDVLTVDGDPHTVTDVQADTQVAVIPEDGQA